jgi:predicted phage replisome organizer
MSEQKKYYWLRLKEDFFKQKEMKKLRRIAGGDTFTIIYLKMQLLTVKADGILKFDGIEDTFADELALELDEAVENVKMTLLFLQQTNLIEIISDNEYLLPEALKNIGCESDSAERVRRHRERKTLQSNNIPLQSNAATLQCNTPVTKCNTELELEKELKIKQKKERIPVGENPQPPQTFNPFFSRISALNDDDTPLPFYGRTHTENQPEPKPEPPATFEDALNSARMSQENGQRLEQARMLWNTIDTLPKYRYLSIQIPPDNLGPILRMMSVYSDTEITQAIKNYADILSRPDLNPFPRYGNFATFMGKGVEMYCDDAKPYERCKKTSGFETAQEREERERQAALAYSRKLDEEYEQQQLEAAR